MKQRTAECPFLRTRYSNNLSSKSFKSICLRINSYGLNKTFFRTVFLKFLAYCLESILKNLKDFVLVLYRFGTSSSNFLIISVIVVVKRERDAPLHALAELSARASGRRHHQL